MPPKLGAQNPRSANAKRLENNERKLGQLARSIAGRMDPLDSSQGHSRPARELCFFNPPSPNLNLDPRDKGRRAWLSTSYQI